MVKRYHVDFECVPSERFGGELCPVHFDGHIYIDSDDGEDFPSNDPPDQPTAVVLASDYEALEKAVQAVMTAEDAFSAPLSFAEYSLAQQRFDGTIDALRAVLVGSQHD